MSPTCQIRLRLHHQISWNENCHHVIYLVVDMIPVLGALKWNSSYGIVNKNVRLMPCYGNIIWEWNLENYWHNVLFWRSGLKCSTWIDEEYWLDALPWWHYRERLDLWKLWRNAQINEIGRATNNSSTWLSMRCVKGFGNIIWLTWIGMKSYLSTWFRSHSECSIVSCVCSCCNTIFYILYLDYFDDIEQILIKWLVILLSPEMAVWK